MNFTIFATNGKTFGTLLPKRVRYSIIWKSPWISNHTLNTCRLSKLRPSADLWKWGKQLLTVKMFSHHFWSKQPVLNFNLGWRKSL